MKSRFNTALYFVAFFLGFSCGNDAAQSAGVFKPLAEMDFNHSNLTVASSGFTIAGPPSKPPGNYCEINLMVSGFFVGSTEHEGGSYNSPWGSIVPLDVMLSRVCKWVGTPSKKELPKRLLLNGKPIWTDTEGCLSN